MEGEKETKPHYPHTIIKERKMKIKEAKYKKVKRVVNERISQEVYGCDNCKVVIDMNLKNRTYLELTVHHHNSEYESHQLCSWKCVLEFLPTVKTDYFVSLPFLSYDEEQVGLRAKDFLKLSTPHLIN